MDMQQKVRQFVGFFFDGLPYSEETEAARARIEAALENERPD